MSHLQQVLPPRPQSSQTPSLSLCLASVRPSVSGAQSLVAILGLCSGPALRAAFTTFTFASVSVVWGLPASPGRCQCHRRVNEGRQACGKLVFDGIHPLWGDHRSSNGISRSFRVQTRVQAFQATEPKLVNGWILAGA